MSTRPISARLVGILGAGSMAEAHLAALQRLGVRAIAYSPSGRAAALAPRFDAIAAHTLEDLLAEADVVDICAPTDTHRGLSEAACRAGLPVICEKPLARTRTDALAIIDGARRAGVHLHVAHVVRYFAAYRIAHDLIGRGEIGIPKELRLSRTGAAPAAAWFRDDARSGGVLMDQMIHDFDFARWVLGPVATVEAAVSRTRTATGEPEVRATATIHHESGATAHLDGGWLAPGTPFATSLRATGSGGEVRHTNTDGAVRLVRGATTPDATTDITPIDIAPIGTARNAATEWATDGDLPYDAQLADFLRAIDGGPAPRISASEALAALDLTLAAIESARIGAPIRVGSV